MILPAPTVDLRNGAGTVVIRPARPGDIGFVVGNWISSQRSVVPFGECPSPLYKARMRRSVHALLHRPGVQLAVACLPTDLDSLRGFAVYETVPTWTVHFVYTKGIVRGCGLASGMLQAIYPAVGSVVTRVTARCRPPGETFARLCERRRFVYDPFDFFTAGERAA